MNLPEIDTTGLLREMENYSSAIISKSRIITFTDEDRQGEIVRDIIQDLKRKNMNGSLTATFTEGRVNEYNWTYTKGEKFMKEAVVSKLRDAVINMKNKAKNRT